MFTRRNWMAATGGFLGLVCRYGRADLLAATTSPRTKRCIVLWMEGGPSQFETFDPKPRTETGGPTATIATAVPGVHISEHLPQLAKQMKQLTLLRHVGSEEGEHLRATYYLHTGYRQVPGFPRPSLGSIVSHESMPANIPLNVTLGDTTFGPAFLGLRHASFSINDPAETLALLRRVDRRRDRLAFLQSMNREFDAKHPDPNVLRRTASLEQVRTLANSAFVRALDLDLESKATREQYGDGEFGKRCLLARRLLEAGVRFVEVRQNGWDTHRDNFAASRRLCGALDQPFAALLTDLATTGLLDETLVVWMGDFGRTPFINAQQGRDHFPQVTPVVLAGAGTSGAIGGATNDEGTAIEGEAYTVPDLFATMLAAIGVDPQLEFRTDFDAPTTITDGGRVIPGVL